jgi:hypothetical protein
MFIALMEKILWLYSLPYDEHYPVVCFDERPCFLIEDVVAALPMLGGQVAKEHYSYQKNGSCCLLAAIEPHTGKRVGQVHQQRTKKQYCLFMQALAAQYPSAHKIRLVQDNLNTHNPSAFYQWLPAQQAFELADRFEFYYTPKSASWLNMIEIEFSALAKGCLRERIPSQEHLERQVLALLKEREEKQVKINWQFSLSSARNKLNRHYTKVNEDNQKYQLT